MTEVAKRKTGKVVAIIGICAAIAAGGIGVATVPGLLPGSASNDAGTVQSAAPEAKPVELGVTPSMAQWSGIRWSARR